MSPQMRPSLLPHFSVEDSQRVNGADCTLSDEDEGGVDRVDDGNEAVIVRMVLESETGLRGAENEASEAVLLLSSDEGVEAYLHVDKSTVIVKCIADTGVEEVGSEPSDSVALLREESVAASGWVKLILVVTEEFTVSKVVMVNVLGIRVLDCWGLDEGWRDVRVVGDTEIVSVLFP